METNQNRTQLTRKQKQAAVVCAICALALIVTICVTAVQVTKAIAAAGEESSSSSSNSNSNSTGYTGENYVIDATVNDAILTETEDMGEEYLKETLFVGDSNTVRFYNNGLLSTQQFCALEGLTVQSALTEEFVTFKKDDKLYTVAESVAKMKPRRVIITLGTNNADGNMSTAAFVSSYEALVDSILESYEYADIIINSIPPVMESQTAYPDLNQETIDEMNMALAEFAQESGYKFLNTAQVLKDKTGYGNPDYYVSNDIHLKVTGLDAILTYATTHAYVADDRRPNTDNIAQRTNSAASASGTTGTASSSTVDYTAKYFVDSAGGGTLTSGDEKDKVNFSFDIKKKDDSVTVTAVPKDGYVFVKWSDGVTTAKRTDTSFTQNVNVTAVFGAVEFSVVLNTTEIKVGVSAEFEAKVSGGYASIDTVVWYVNGKVNSASALGKSWVPIESGVEYAVYATITYNGVTLTSETIKIEPPTLIPVPVITGLTEAEAKKALTDKGLKVGTITYVETSDSAQIGKVTFQKTNAGDEVAAGSAIDFTVGKAAEVKKYTVPNVAGKNAADATAALKAAGFTGAIDTTSKTAYSSTVAEGCVIEQSVAAGTSATADTSFVLTISKGAEPPATATVQDVTNLTQTAATDQLQAQGFKVAVVEANHDTVAVGSVISYSPSGTQNIGTTITITISIGPKVVEPTPPPATTPEPTATVDPNAGTT